MAKTTHNSPFVHEGVDQELLEAGKIGGASRLDKLTREIKTFRRFVRLLWPFKDKAILIMLLILVGVPMSEIGVFLGRVFIDDVVLNTEKSVGERLTLFYILLVTQLFFWVVGHSMSVLRQVFGFYLDFSVSIRLRKTFYSHLHKLSLGFLASRPVGEHMFRTTSDVSGGGRAGVIYMITDDIPEAFRLIYQVIWAAVLLCMVDWLLAVAVFVYILPYTGLAHYLYTRLKGALRQQKVQAQRVSALLRDGIKGIQTIKGFGRIDLQVYKYTQQVYRERRVWWKYQLLTALTHHVALWFVNYTFRRGMYIYATYQIMTGNLSLGEFIVVWRLLAHLERPLEQFMKLLQYIRLQLVPAERVLETLGVEPDIVDAPDAPAMQPIEGRVEFRDVHFEYLPGEPVLRGLNFAIEPGETVAFVGPSGAGKSTIMYLLMRLYEPQRGSILVDGVDVRTVTQDSFLEQMAVVLQETYLFGGTFADNIRYGKLQATDEEVVHAAQMADMHEFIMSLPEEYDRDLGEGLKLSGGQRQRLGIARAVIRDPRVLILDEATASLDSKVEMHIVGTIVRAMRGRTSLMISHRLVTVTGCDRIIVIDRGQVVDEGTHGELLARGGLYRQLWDEQTKGATES